MGMARRRARGVSRRELLRLGVIGIGMVSLGAACAPTPPAAPAQPPAAPAKPAEPAKPVAPAAPVATTAPAAAAQPATAPAAQPGQLGQRPDHDRLRGRAGHDRAEGRLHQQRLLRAGQRLRSPDRARLVVGPGQARAAAGRELEPGSTRTPGASSSARASSSPTARRSTPTRWSRPSRTSPIPQKPGLAIGEYGTLQSAKKVDEFTADIITKDPDPIFPERLVHFPIPAPNWLKTANLSADLHPGGRQRAVHPGRVRAEGHHLLFKANPNYWGPNKPKIAEIKLIGRREQAVRSAMLQAGEANLAFHIALDEAKKAPRTIIEQTQESVIFDDQLRAPGDEGHPGAPGDRRRPSTPRG